MRGAARTALALLLAACGRDVAPAPQAQSSAVVRAARRAYDGAPPTIPHAPFSDHCAGCHRPEGLALPDVGFAPNLPHTTAEREGRFRRCTQCHVYRKTTESFRSSTFQGLRQDLRAGKRGHALAPPVMPHALLLRENCQACHTGPAAREEIRCPHPERARCVQCHVPRQTTGLFNR